MELITSAARAAQSAAEAARTMKEVSEAKNRSNFSEASKVVKCPEFFGYPTSDEDQNCWRDFAFSFKAWLIFADSGFEAELEQIEKTSDTVFSVPTNAETLQRAHKLYAILSGLPSLPSPMTAMVYVNLPEPKWDIGSEWDLMWEVGDLMGI